LDASAADRYRARFRAVLEYIDAHLDEDLGVERLGGVTAFSKYHFHRQFSGLFGMGVSRYVQLVRLKRASYLLAFRADSVVDIALASGYAGPEAFARAFRKNTGQSPSEFREQPRWDLWHPAFEPLNQVRTRQMKTQSRGEQVRLVEFNTTRVAVLEHRGDPRLLGDSIRRFIDWRRQNGLSPRVSETFNIAYDNPAETEPEAFRMDLCVSTEREVTDNPYGIVVKTIPGGRCAVLTHVGSDDNLADTAQFLYAEWLPQSGEEPRDFPLYFRRVKFFPDVPEHEAVTEVFLPLCARDRAGGG
jgi:AraC family transcriptional regulator